MKQFIISEEEAVALIAELIKAWVSLDNQKIIYDLIRRLERELNS